MIETLLPVYLAGCGVGFLWLGIRGMFYKKEERLLRIFIAFLSVIYHPFVVPYKVFKAIQPKGQVNDRV